MNSAALKRQPLAEKKRPDSSQSRGENGRSAGRVARLVERFEGGKKSASAVSHLIKAIRQGKRSDALDRIRAGGEDLWRRAASLDACGALLWLRQFADDRVESFTNRCRSPLLCGSCAIIRAMKLCTKYGPIIEAACLPGIVPHFLTLTVRDGPDLAERFRHLNESINLLNERRRNSRRRHQPTALAGMAGGVFSIEVTRGKGSGLWHPHAHCLLLSPGPIDDLVIDERGRYRWPALSDEWHGITGDSFIVECHPITASPADDDAEGLLDALENSGQAVGCSPTLRRAIAETFKYPLKVCSMSPLDVLESWSIVRGRRFIRSFGSLFGVADPAESSDELPSDADGSFVDWFYRWASGRYSLVGTRIGGSHV